LRSNVTGRGRRSCFHLPAGDIAFVRREGAVISAAGFARQGVAPLIKTIVATAGTAHRDRRSRCTHRRPARPEIPCRRVDGKGRVLGPYAGGIVPAGNVFLYSPYSASWDSRYFGPMPASGILGLAQQVLTYAP
jgi:type IV secretory pathway protease TraF